MPEGTHSFDFQGPQEFWGKQQSTVLKRKKSSTTKGSCLGTSSLSKMPLNSTTNPHPQWRVWICLKCREVFWNKVLLKSFDFTKDSQSGRIRINLLLVKAFLRGRGSLFLLCYYLMSFYQGSQWLSAWACNFSCHFYLNLSHFENTDFWLHSDLLFPIIPSQANNHLMQENAPQNHLSRVFCGNHHPVTFRFWLGEIEGDVALLCNSYLGSIRLL